MSTSNRTQFVILGLLSEGPRTGYDIKQEIENAINFFWHESYGQIYPTLQKLVEKGWAEVEAEWKGGRQRKIHRITGAGSSALESWLKDEPTLQPVRNELILKIFFGRNTRPEVLAEHIRGFREQMVARKATFDAIDREMAESPPPGPDRIYHRIALEKGRHLTEARLRWAEEALALLEDLEE